MKGRLHDLREGLSDYVDALSMRIWQWDHRCLEAIGRQPRLRKLSRLFVMATYFGDGYLWLLVVVGLSVFGTSIDRRNVGVMMLVSICNIAAFRLSKRLTKRERPDSIAAKSLKFRVIDSYSFPSGHATTSFGMAYMISIFYPILPVQIAVYTASSLISFSRIYVAEHYPSDVLMGAVLGTVVSALLVPWMLNWLS
jgi:undecaprenyl-diphosphatase